MKIYTKTYLFTLMALFGTIQVHNLYGMMARYIPAVFVGFQHRQDFKRIKPIIRVRAEEFQKKIKKNILNLKYVDNAYSFFPEEETLFFLLPSITMLEKNPSHLTKDSMIEETTAQHPTISREDALQEIKTCTSKLFDETDTRPLKMHIEDIAQWKEYLDKEKDTAVLQIIDLLERNKHKTGIWSIPFWTEIFSNHADLKKLPLSQEITTMSVTRLSSKFIYRIRQ